MRLLLTSMGLSNPSIHRALEELLGKPFSECRAVHIPTAVYALPEGVTASAEMGQYWAALGWKSLGTLELTALPSIDEECWLPELAAADVILVAGGNSGYLSYWFHQSGFAERLPSLLDDTVYVGVSAGSCVLTPGFNYDRDRFESTGVYYDDEYDEAAPLGFGDARGLGLVDFALRPHLDSDDFPDTSMAMMERAAAKVNGPLYAIDDQTAISVVDGRASVVSEGQWRLFDPTRGDQA